MPDDPSLEVLHRAVVVGIRVVAGELADHVVDAVHGRLWDMPAL